MTNWLSQWNTLTPQQQKQLLTGFGSAVAVLALYLLALVWPMAHRLQIILPEMTRVARELKGMEGSVGHQAQVAQQAAALQEQLRRVQQQFLLEGEVSTTALEKLSNFANASGMKIDVMQPMKPEALPADAVRHYLEVPIWVDAKGSYHQLGSFLDKIEHDPQLIQVRRLEINGNPTELRRHNIRLVLLASVLHEAAAGATGVAP